MFSSAHKTTVNLSRWKLRFLIWSCDCWLFWQQLLNSVQYPAT